MSTVAHCTACGATLPTGMLGNRCPRCLVQLALATPGDDELAPAQLPAPSECSPGRGRFLGDYELLEVIARGGMGIVYRARQRSLNRIVAVKLMLSSGQLAQPEVAQRFRTEAQAAAHLNHPNIVAVHEVGEHEGQPYFSMEYVEGRTLADIVRDGPLPAHRAASYLKTVSEAVQYAHTHEILHRDLKPSNVLIDLSDQPRITDFGLAKWLTGDSELTLSGQVLGSPNYLSPEQAAGRQEEVGPASDVYALGAMLYHLLTGRPPFQGDSLTVLLRQVLEADPVSPHLLNPGIPRDLETICLKCLEKDRSRRFGTAQVLADELERFLRGEPIRARPVGRPEKVWRWCGRKPALAAAVGMVVLVAVAGSAGILWQWRAAVQAQSRAVQERYDATISEAQILIEQQRFDRARKLLEREAKDRDRGWEWGWLQRLCNLDLMTLKHANELICVAFSPDGRFLVAGGFEGAAAVYDLQTGQKVTTLSGHRTTVFSCAFSPDGQRIVTASFDGTARVWEKNGTNVLVLPHSAHVTDAAFSPDGRMIATAALCDGLKLWDARSGNALPEQIDLGQSVTALTFSPDGGQLACATGPFVFDNDADAIVHVISLGNRQRRSFLAHRSMIARVRFSPDGSRLATASLDGNARVWDTATGRLVLQLEAVFQGDTARGVAFSPDGKWLAVCGAGGHVGGARIFEVQTGRLVRSLDGHSIGVTGVAFSPDGTRLATMSYDKTARIWSTEAQPEFLSLEGHDQPVWTIAFSRDGRRLASGSFDHTARVWDTETASLLTTVNVGFPVISLAFSPEGGRLVTVATNHTAKVWNAANGQEILTLHGHSGTVMSVAWSQDGRRILTGSKDGTARLWEARTGVLERTIPGHTHWVLGVAFSPDSRYFATGSGDNTARVWETETGRSLTMLRGHGDWVQQVVFSPDGQYVATGCEDQFARLFDAKSGRLLLPPMEGHRAGVSALAFSPDGTRLATAGGGVAPLSKVYAYDRSTILWDLRTGQRLLKLDAHSSWVLAVAFSPDGKRLATGSLDNTIRIREAFPWKSADYSQAVNVSLGEQVEAFKRSYWREKLSRVSWTIPLGTRPVKPGRRLQFFRSIEVNLPAQSGTKTVPANPIPPRDPNVAADLVDLAHVYNMALSETWLPASGPLDVDLSLSSLPVGVHVLAGVPFDVRGIIRLTQASYGYAMFPTNVQIAVGRKFHQLHVLHGTESHAPNGRQIGAYRLHYRDGGSVELKIVYGRDLLAWKRAGAGAFRGMKAQEAWSGAFDQTQPEGLEVLLYRCTYENPEPGREVTCITFESAMITAGPFLVAMTVGP